MNLCQVVITGSGANGVKMARKKKLDMAENPTCSVASDERLTELGPLNSQKQKTDEIPLTPTDALAMLASALNQCKKAGVNWTKRQQETHLLLAIPNAEIANTGNGELGILPILAMGDK